MHEIISYFKSKNWMLLLLWIPIYGFHLPALHWKTLNQITKNLSDIISDNYWHISVCAWGPNPDPRASCTITAFSLAIVSVYCIVLRAISLYRKKKNYDAFAIPFSLIFLLYTYQWLGTYHLVQSYIHQLGMTPQRQYGVTCMLILGLIWLIVSAALAYPWEKHLLRKDSESAETVPRK